MEPGLQFCTECGTAGSRAPDVAPRPPAPPQWDSTLVAAAPPLFAYDEFAATEITAASRPKSRKLPLIIVGVGTLAIVAIVALLVLKPFSNEPPVLGGIDASQSLVLAGGSVTLTARATDPNDDALTYRWIASAGQIIGDGSTVRLSTAGAGPYSGRTDIRVHVTVSDGRGETASADQTISIHPAIIANVEPPTVKPELTSIPQPTPDLNNVANSPLNANGPRTVTQANLRLSSSIDGAALLIDEVPRGTLSIHRARVLRLSAGFHTILAQKPGYTPWSRSVNLANGVTETLSIAMEPLGPTPDQVASQYFQRAEKLLQQGNYDAAIAACDEGLRLAVGNRLLVQKRDEIERARQRRVASLREEEERRRKTEANESQDREAVPVERFQPAVAKKRVKPDYPAIARTSRTYGKVIVEVTIDAQGGVSTAKAIGGPLMLHQAAINAAKQWKFEPARRGGRAVFDTMTIAFDFTL
jgi:TonB family protein